MCSTYPTVFTKQPSRLAIYGTCSLILYILLLQLIVKYILITMYADDNEEGETASFQSGTPQGNLQSLNHQIFNLQGYVGYSTSGRDPSQVLYGKILPHSASMAMREMKFSLLEIAGGTFAIYSLLCRRIGITPFGEQQVYGKSSMVELKAQVQPSPARRPTVKARANSMETSQQHQPTLRR